MSSRLLQETDPTPSPVIERLEARIAELEAELAAIESQAEDRTEYVLAQINAGLRAELATARAESWALRRYVDRLLGQSKQGDSNG